MVYGGYGRYHTVPYWYGWVHRKTAFRSPRRWWYQKIYTHFFSVSGMCTKITEGHKMQTFCSMYTTNHYIRLVRAANSQPRMSSLFYFLIYSVYVALQKLWLKSSTHLCVLNSFTSFSTLMGVAIEFTLTSSLVSIMVS